MKIQGDEKMESLREFGYQETDFEYGDVLSWKHQWHRRCRQKNFLSCIIALDMLQIKIFCTPAHILTDDLSASKINILNLLFLIITPIYPYASHPAIVLTIVKTPHVQALVNDSPQSITFE